MANVTKISRSLALVAVALLWSAGLSASALELEARLLGQGSAILLIDGKQYRLQAGERSDEGVLLVSSDGRTAVVEYQGREQRLTLNRPIASNYTQAERTEVRIQPGAGGHYVTTGRINGRELPVVVDTGATSVAMNQVVAEQLGINYRAGTQTRVSTASGMATAYEVVLDRIALGPLELRQVKAVVILGNFPQITLLGNSYLGAFDWQMDAGVLLLRSRY